MPHICDTRGKSYVYKRNLKHHIKERHLPIEHWNCTETNCLSQFIRRSYLSTHLILKHGYDKKSAIETAITAPRGDISQQSGFYEDISDDDTILDLLYERNNSMKEQDFSETVDNFDTGLFGQDTSVSGVNDIDDVLECDVDVEIMESADVDSMNQDNNHTVMTITT